MQQIPDIMGMGDVMSELNVSRQRVDEYIRKGKLPYKETSAGKIFLKHDVMKLKQQLAKHPRSKIGRRK